MRARPEPARPEPGRQQPARPSQQPATGAASTRSSGRVVGGLLLLGLLYMLQLSEAPRLEVHRQATTSLQNQASSTLERIQALGSSLGQGIAEAESEDLLDMWGEPPQTGAKPAAEVTSPALSSKPAAERPAAASQAEPLASQALSRVEAEPQAPARSAAKPPPPPPAEAAEAAHLGRQVAHALAAGLPPAKACAEGCHTRGNCNEELGRCDCPPLSEGPICDRGVVPKCRTQWGLSLPHPPCQAWTSEESDWRARPPVTHATPPVAPCHPACDPM